MPGVPARLRSFARPVRKDAVQDVQRLPHLLRRRVRAEVDDPAPVPLPREHHARVLVLDGHGDVWIALVVAQADVEGRPVALDQVLLEVEGLHLGGGNDHLDLLDALDQPIEPEPAVPAAEVRANAGTQRLGLADVEDAALSTTEQVDARLRGEPLQLLLDPLLAGGCGRGGHVQVSLASRPTWPRRAGRQPHELRSPSDPLARNDSCLRRVRRIDPALGCHLRKRLHRLPRPVQERLARVLLPATALAWIGCSLVCAIRARGPLERIVAGAFSAFAVLSSLLLWYILTSN